MAKTVLITNLDMSDFGFSPRISEINRLASSVSEYLKERYPSEQGYKHSKRQTTGGDQNPNSVTTFVKVHRGLFWGYVVTFKSLDTETSRVSVLLSTYTILFEIVAASALVPTVLLAIGLLRMGWLNEWVFDNFGHLGTSIIILLVILIGFASLFWFLAQTIFPGVHDKVEQEQEKDNLRQEINDLIARPSPQS